MPQLSVGDSKTALGERGRDKRNITEENKGDRGHKCHRGHKGYKSYRGCKSFRGGIPFGGFRA